MERRDLRALSVERLRSGQMEERAREGHAEINGAPDRHAPDERPQGTRIKEDRLPNRPVSEDRNGEKDEDAKEDKTVHQAEKLLTFGKIDDPGEAERIIDH